MKEYDEFIEMLERIGEVEVKSRLSQGVWASRRKQWAVDWLAANETARKEARDEIALSISKEDNKIAKSSLRLSMVAIVVAVATAIAGLIR